MEKRYLVLFFLVLTSGVVAYQLIDPELEDQPREVDFSETPSEIGFDAMKQLEERDYTYLMTWTFTNRSNLTGEFEITRTRIEHSDDEYRVDVLTDKLRAPNTVYANRFNAWGKYEGSWSRKTQFAPYQDDRSPFEKPTHIRNISVIRANETGNTLTLEVTNSTAVYFILYGDEPGEEVTAKLYLYIDKQTGELRRAVFHGAAPGKTYNKSVEYKFGDFGTTTVTRPSDVHYTIDELFWDLLH